MLCPGRQYIWKVSPPSYPFALSPGHYVLGAGRGGGGADEADEE